MKDRTFFTSLNDLDKEIMEETEKQPQKRASARTLRVVLIAAAIILALSAVFGVLAAQSNTNSPVRDLFIVSVLNKLAGKYKRITFKNETLGEYPYYIDDNTTVTCNDTLNDDLPDTLPIYRIKKHTVSAEEFNRMLRQLDLTDNDPTHLLDNNNPSNLFEVKENRITVMLASPVDTSRGYFDMTDEELEQTAWDILGKMPFAKDNYEYLGSRSSYTIEDSEGTHTTRVGVSFRRILEGLRIVGCDRINMYFDGSGLVELFIELYDYEEIGRIDLTPLADAKARIKTPDSFSVDETDTIVEKIETLQAEKVNLFYYNQFTDGCEVLQPVYCFFGTAIDVNKRETSFKSIIVAVPESYTY